MRSIIRLRLPATAAAALLCMSAVTSVQAQSVTYELVARSSGRCLDVTDLSTANGARIQQWTCHGGSHQQWLVQPAGEGYSIVVSVLSGKALDVADWSLADGGAIQQWDIHGGNNQQWLLHPVGDGYYNLLSRHSGKALDVTDWSDGDGTPIQQWTLHGGSNQQWLLRERRQPATTTSADAVRLLEQATWGPTPELLQHVRDVGIERFLDEQFDAPGSGYPTLPLFPTTRDTTTCPNNSACQRDNYTMYPVQTRFFVNALYGTDQLRQRVAFALHQILVVSGVEVTQPSWMTPYLQTLERNAFGSFRQLLYEITLNAAMGNYLDMNGNTRTRPNENYAREVLQLFSIGTVRLKPNGAPQLDGSGQPIPTYDQSTINNFARVFTGWRFAPGQAGIPNYLDPMVPNAAQHDTDAKTLLNGYVVQAGQTPQKDLDDAIDNILNDPNVGPFISKQLIQHLVTSNPSPAYVERVAAAFNSNGSGDLRAVVRAILTDPEARGDQKTDAAYGRLRNPIQLLLGVLRAFNARSADLSGQSDGYLNPQAAALGMDVFRPPSVFSYYSPFGTVPGESGLRGPEFALLSTSTALQRANVINTLAFSRIAVSANAPSGTALDLRPLQPLASNAGQLADTLDTLLLHGTMSASTRQSIVTAVSAVPATNSLKRVQTAVYLVATSSQYQVEK
jgi:uncharacterized protein (DUF1800 family)